MVYRRFNFQLVLRVLFLLGTLCLLAWILVNTSLILSPLLLGILAVAQVWELIGYVNRANEQLVRFLNSILHNDFSFRLNRKVKGKSWESYYEAATLIADKMKQMNAEKEAQHLFLQLLTENAGAGLIAFNAAGEIELCNEPARKLLGVNHLRQLRSLDRIAPDMGSRLSALKPGERTLVKIVTDKGLMQIAVRATAFRGKDGEMITLLALQHIGPELEEQEYLAWQKLISVLTHEVMNSVTPIISLSSTVNLMLEQYAGSAPDAEMIELDKEGYSDIRSAVGTIESRSKGMLNFVQAYRKLNKVPVPELDETDAKDLIENIVKMKGAGLTEKGIEIVANVPEHYTLLADRDLVEQVLLNLLKNAEEALEGRSGAKIQLSVHQAEDASQTIIRVEDNGPGVPDAIAEKIFIPFYTTRPEGTGIGLSLCKQIMRAHGGDIHLQQSPGKGALFLLYFPSAGSAAGN